MRGVDDIIALASHVLGVGLKDAALAIAGATVPTAPTVPPKPPVGEENVLNPLGHLVIDESVTALLSKEDAEAVGIGLCRKGLMAKRIVIPIRTDTGKLVGYAGYSPEDKTLKLPPKGLRL